MVDSAPREGRSRSSLTLAYLGYLVLGFVGLVGALVWLVEIAAPGYGELAALWAGFFCVPLAIAGMLAAVVCTALAWREKTLRLLASLLVLAVLGTTFESALGRFGDAMLGLLGLVTVVFLVVPIRALTRKPWPAPASS